MASNARIKAKPKTWSLLGDVRRKPSPYEVVTSNFHTHFRRDPQPFEHPGMPLNGWYLQHREGSPFQVDDWEQFRDPFKLTYKDYVASQDEREVFVDKLIDQHECAESAPNLNPEWVATLERFFVPLRFPLHILQMTGLYVGQMAPSSFITNCANFQAADEMRRIQRLAYWTKVLANAHGDRLASTEVARTAWEQDPLWQPLREALERLLIAYDWGESFAALNLVVKPLLDTLLNVQFAALAGQNGDEFLRSLFTDFGEDSKRSQTWSAALVRYSIERDPQLKDVLLSWIAQWQPLMLEAVGGLGQLLEKAPKPIAAVDLTEAVTATQHEYLQACGLLDPPGDEQ
ncbi:aromatic/alkene monooxygenase hydroxylase subunit beta [Rhodococcus sp. HM1]|uniref:aromatic/alkene monooxygenase hydroxylase subunit beta n=1 Tax=unclassified Rhodococcus (in: high G+C Gram-positive bacteria) TaxID=192944 RepID=UPI0018CFBE9E|nr:MULTISPECIES: aromatic/alkene monooxygenase hydroxylase subunit beta [unclassified Rhodococcus (in: high G+C Gram-positive bacteria)]MBH0121730.1 aromatic/alkene monooxygenase hydroxylase subunit beta [Rhodococcus sp. CX]MCK8673742.1 aromatic/alkene monooxygenase hydroxylase subunit beta [Rhodococcus sp. HM1]